MCSSARSASSRSGCRTPRPSWRRKDRASWCCAVRVGKRSRCTRGRTPRARPGYVRPRSSSIRRSTGSSPRSLSRPRWKSRDRGGGALRRPRDGDRCVGSGVSRGRAHDHRGGSQAPGAYSGAETGASAARGLRSQVPRCPGTGRDYDPGHARRRAQLTIHRPARPAPTGALMVSRALTTFTVGFLLLDALLLAYSGVALGRRWLVFWGAVCLVAAVLVVIGWRRYRRVMSDLEHAPRRAISWSASTRRPISTHSNASRVGAEVRWTPTPS